MVPSVLLTVHRSKTRSYSHFVRMDSGVNSFDEHVLSPILPFLCGIEKGAFLAHLKVSKETILCRETTDPLNYTILEAIREWVHAKFPGCLPVGMVTGPKYISFVLEEVVPISPKDLPVF